MATSALQDGEAAVGERAAAQQLAALARLRARPGFAAALRHSTLAPLDFHDRDPARLRAFADISALSLGLLAIHLDANGGLHHRGMRSLAGRGGLISAGRSTALLWRMQRLGFMAPVGAFQRGKERIYKPLPGMLEAIKERIRVELQSAALIDDRVPPLLARFDEPGVFTRFNSLLITRIIDGVARGDLEAERPLGGVLFLAAGSVITLAIVALAYEAGHEGVEGSVTVSLSAFARRFDVSRPHVRRVVKQLEARGLEADPNDPQRFTLTPAFRANFEFLYSIFYAGLIEAAVQV